LAAFTAIFAECGEEVGRDLALCRNRMTPQDYPQVQPEIQRWSEITAGLELPISRQASPL
ncbi:MAG TPA: hypothetical protein VMR25_21610, partial [Planctomycetaceae bacterium]|nr:hypothetical protein [Planctomycetaceae bacterium]